MRQEFLHVPKFWNDHSGEDEMAVRVSEHIRIVLESRQNIKGFNFRPSLFQFMGHTYAGPMLGATPDGRLSREPLAHGMNPMHGRNSGGMTATIRSFCKLDFRKYQGGSLQIELQPNFFPQQQRRGDLVDPFATSFFQMGGVQINLNVIALEKLQRAMEEPELPEHQEIVVKVTGYSAHFVVMDRKFQEEFVERVNYKRLGPQAKKRACSSMSIIFQRMMDLVFGIRFFSKAVPCVANGVTIQKVFRVIEKSGGIKINASGNSIVFAFARLKPFHFLQMVYLSIEILAMVAEFALITARLKPWRPSAKRGRWISS